MDEGFAPGAAEQLDAYAYLLVDPRSRRPFYAGKGRGGRCFAHLKAARNTRRAKRGDFVKLVRIRQIEKSVRAVQIKILRHGLDDQTAFEVESAAIDLLGFDDLSNLVEGAHARSRGDMTVREVNALLGACPVRIARGHRVILIRVARAFRRGMSDEEVYKITRGFWKVARKWAKPRSEDSPQYAFAVFGGVVRAVYEISRWREPTRRELRENPGRRGRLGFIGHVDHAMENRYVGGDVAEYLSPSAQNPITYVNCGPDRQRR